MSEKLTTKEVLNLFKDARWQTDQEVDEFVASAPVLAVADVLRLLDGLTNRWLAADGERHDRRLAAFSKLAETVTDRALFGPYVRTLRTPDLRVRAMLGALIPLVNSVGDHAELCALLRSTDADLRRQAAVLLARLGGKTAFEILSAMVAEVDFAGRGEAMDVLAALGAHRAVDAFASVLAVGTTDEKHRAIRHLVAPGCLGKERDAALAVVARALADRSESVRSAALSALADHASEEEYFRLVGPAFDDPSPSVVRSAVLGLRNFTSARTVEALRRALKVGPNVVRFAALTVLETLGAPEFLDPIVDALGDKRLVVRTRAAEVLSRLGRARRIDVAHTVLWLLRSRDVNVRRMAVEVAHSVPDPRGELWPSLLDYLFDEDWWVRERVIDALVDLAGKDLVPRLFEHLRDDTNVVKRYHAVEILRRLRAPEALGALIRTASSDTDWLVRERAIEAIAALRDPAAGAFLSNLMMQSGDCRLACLQALAEIGAKDAAPHVALLLANQSLEVDERLAVVRCLGSLDDPAQAHAVRHLLRDPELAIRGLAQRLLARWDIALGPRPAAAAAAGASVLDQLLVAMGERGGDDLILSPGRKPFMKRMGQVVRLAQNTLSAEQVRALLLPHLSPQQLDDLAARRDADFSCEVPVAGYRFRANVFLQSGGLGAVFRIVRNAMPTLAALGLPPVVASLADLRNGLVLIGGPAGAGKSTTLAALVDSINVGSARHIVTLEDPIEVVHRRKASLVNQREVGTHTGSFGEALRSTLRQDPDVLLVGEMRDHPTIAFGMTAAETGHLVFGTIHTVSAATSIERLIGACPPNQQDHARALLAGSLRAVVCQYLLSRRDGQGRCLATEVLLNNDAVANLIRKGKTHQIPSVIATSRAQGMQLMDVDLLRLAREGLVAPEDAYVKAVGKKEFEALLPPEARPSGAAGQGA